MGLKFRIALNRLFRGEWRPAWTAIDHVPLDALDASVWPRIAVCRARGGRARANPTIGSPGDLPGVRINPIWLVGATMVVGRALASMATACANGLSMATRVPIGRRCAFVYFGQCPKLADPSVIDSHHKAGLRAFPTRSGKVIRGSCARAASRAGATPAPSADAASSSRTADFDDGSLLAARRCWAASPVQDALHYLRSRPATARPRSGSGTRMTGIPAATLFPSQPRRPRPRRVGRSAGGATLDCRSWPASGRVALRHHRVGPCDSRRRGRCAAGPPPTSASGWFRSTGLPGTPSWHRRSRPPVPAGAEPPARPPAVRPRCGIRTGPTPDRVRLRQRR
jgi:hypothetical protein